MASQKKKILIQRADRLGDVILSLPVIDELEQLYPDAELFMLTSTIGREFLKDHPALSKIFVTNERHSLQSPETKELLYRLQEEEIDIYVSLWNHPKMAWIGALAKIPVRIGDKTNWGLSHLYTHPIRQHWEDLTRHQIEFNLDLLTPLGGVSGLRKGKIPVSAVAVEKVQAILDKWMNPGKKKVVIFTGTGGTNEPIPESAVAAFIRKMASKNEFQIILAGQEREQSIFNDYHEHHVLNLVGKTTLSELVALISEADMYIGPDTGPTHIASFLGKPMVFFSSMKPNPPARWGSLSPYCQTIRKEYMCYHKDIHGCRPDTCFGYVTGDLLYQQFGELLSRLELNDARTGKELKEQHLKNTFRVLYVTDSLEDYDRLFNAINKWRDDGLMIFPYVVRDWGMNTLFKLLKWVVLHNISVLQGPIPKPLVWGVQGVMGMYYKYTKPVYLSMPLYPDFYTEDCLELAIDEFKKK